ncbi:MAG: helix-turn-helix domain-containing protein [Polymorphobacter sp.]|uniref:AraC family transcriptional regulator n=1 Tax=Polymorphobacter sp. TaxID=1909290 RepID=UPI003A846E9E
MTDTMVLPQMQFRLPAEPLRALVSSYYWFDTGSFAIDDMIHPEWTNIRFTLTGRWTVQRLGGPLWAFEDAAVFGPSSRGAQVISTPHSALLGLGLLPLGWARLMGGPARRLADQAVPLEREWADAGALRAAVLAADGIDDWAAILDAALMRRLVEAPEPPPMLARALDVLVNGEISDVAHYAGAVGVSVRTLERLCSSWFGFGPKSLLRRQRFLRSLDVMMRMPDVPLGQAYHPGYVDQSHFIHEFKMFMGMAPGRYLAQPRVMMQRAALARQALLGQSLQGLQPPAA